jgi:hypothetical protein
MYSCFTVPKYYASLCGFAGAGAQVQVNPATGQPDYSIQWAEYYRSLGMHREAEMIEQQAKASKVQCDISVDNKGL